MIITREFIESGSIDGSWNYNQFKILGLSTPPRAGWIDRLEGTEISSNEARQFISVRRKTNCDYDVNGVRVTFTEKASERLAKKAITKQVALNATGLVNPVFKKIKVGEFTLGKDKKSFVGTLWNDAPKGASIEIRREGDVYVMTATVKHETPHPKSIAAKFPPPDKSEVYDDGLGCPFTPGKFFHHNDGRIEQVG